MFIMILTARCASVIGCSWVLNVLGSEIRPSFQILMWMSGLKGVIAFALASRALREFDHGDIMITITLLFSITGVRSYVDPCLWYSLQAGCVSIRRAQQRELGVKPMFGFKRSDRTP